MVAYDKAFRRGLATASAMHQYPPLIPRKPAFVGFSELKRDILDDILNTSKTSSVRPVSLPKFGRLLEGFRKGEMTIFSGPTGSGKTTVLSQLSLDYCMQGVGTLWGSFEVRNARLGQIMLQQVADLDMGIGPNSDVESLLKDIDRASEKMAALPMYFMNYFGSTDLGRVIDTMYDAVTNNSVQHIILDNLQFMLSEQHSFRTDKFELADRSIAAIRDFCNKMNVHVTVVVHPRKEDDDIPLGIASISGTAKATQEADNIVILQKLPKGRFLDLRKNRHAGTLGSVQLEYNKKKRMVFEVDPKSAEDSSDTTDHK